MAGQIAPKNVFDLRPDLRIVFGGATVPSLFAVKWLLHKTVSRTWSRGLASLVMMFFGFQFAMRGFASLALVGHFTLGSVMLW